VRLGRAVDVRRGLDLKTERLVISMPEAVTGDSLGTHELDLFAIFEAVWPGLSLRLFGRGLGAWTWLGGSLREAEIATVFG
jgi:hypothetical protein